MAVAFKTVGASTNGTDASAETAAPSGVVAGDCLLLMVYVRSITTRVTPTTPTGWTLADSALDAASAFGDVYVYWRIATGGADDTPTVTLSASPTGWLTRIMRFDGTDGTTPVDATATATGDSGSDTTTIPDDTAARNGSVAVCCAGKTAAGTDSDQVWPSGWTEIYDDHSGAGYRSFVSGAYDPIDAGAMTAGQVVSGWDSSVAQPVQRVTVILQPPASGSAANSYHYQRNQ